MQQIHHKRNELFEVQFYKDKECTEAFDFKNAKNLYIELINGDITLLLQIGQLYHEKPYDFTIFTPYIPNTVKRFFVNGNTYQSGSKVKTLNDITPNLSKYIPKDNAVLFLGANDFSQYKDMMPTYYTLWFENGIPEINDIDCRDLMNEFLSFKKVTIFLPHGTQSKLQKAEEVEKELMEKYGVEEVNLCVLRCFVDDIYNYNSSFLDDFYKQNYNDAYNELCGMECKPDMTKNEYKKQFEIEKKNHKRECYINKIITTNSTGILKPKDSNERLQVIDCKEIFEEYLKENN